MLLSSSHRYNLQRFRIAPVEPLTRDRQQPIRALTIGARYDEMDPEDMKKMATLMPNASSFICPNGSHLCMWDDQAFYFKNLLNYLQTL